MVTINHQKRRLIAWSARSTRSALYLDSFSLLTVPNLLTCSIDKKGKFSRKRLNEEEGDITYINEHNRVFNKKVGFFFVNLPIQVTLSLLPYRLRGTTTNIHQRFGPASSVAQRCNLVFFHTGRLSLIVFYTGFFIVMLDQAGMLSELLAVYSISIHK